MENMDDIQKRERAQQEYLLARDYSKKAQTFWEESGELFNLHKKLSNKLKNWKNILSTAPLLAMNMAFIPVCIAEYYFSKELYRDINEENPWAIAVGFISIGIVISELLVYRFFPQKREWKMYEMRHQNDMLNSETDESLRKKVNTYANQMFLIGMLLASAMLILVTYFSQERAARELAAEMRDNGFGIQDFMPVGLYLFEILTGFFIWFTIRLFYLIIKVYFIKKSLQKNKHKCTELSTMAVKKLEDAEEFGLNLFDLDTKPERDFCTAVYRNKEGNSTDDDNFFKEPERQKNKITFTIKDKGNVVADCKVHIKTEYKVLLSSSTDSNGMVGFEFESFPNDCVMDIMLTRADHTGNMAVSKPDHGSYALNQENPITIDWG
jgi:hypothetical protein